MLKDQPKFSLRTTQVFDSFINSQATGCSTPPSPSSINWDSDFPIDLESPPPIVRPPGRKAEKRKGKRVGEPSELSKVIEETQNFYRDAQEKKLLLNEKKIEQTDRKIELQERQEEDRIMSMDISSFNETQRVYYLCRQREIMKRRGYIP